MPIHNEDMQNLSERRAYCVRPRPDLAQRLKSIGMADDIDVLGQHTVVMTESLPFEGRLEGYRILLLKKCKEAFLEAFIEDGPLSEILQREALLGKGLSLTESFDLWWTAEEIEIIEILTTW